eukprot:GFUD01030942.1.p1 GENE.GFUD01030942.1~~GFUD01030942.1.p1  ORF type:complete len:580 (+),score=110.07 GFUD01030942.1:75-1814(+)
MEINVGDKPQEESDHVDSQNTMKSLKHSDDDLDSKLVETIQNSTGPDGYKCKECNLFYPKKYDMKVHIRTHTGERPYICDFQECDKTYARSEHLRAHKKRNHERILDHICPICGKKFYGRSDMLRHIVIHDEARQSNERVLPPQMMKLLNTVEEFNLEGKVIMSNCVCEICGKIFETKSSKKRHIQTIHPLKSENTNEIKYQPDIKQEPEGYLECSFSDCENQFTSKMELDHHIEESDHDEMFCFTCPKCSRKFLSSLLFKNHCEQSCDMLDPKEECKIKLEEVKQEDCIQQIDPYSPSPQKDMSYSCDLCESYLSSKDALNIHRLIHEELKRFTCKEQDCGDVFKCLKSLTKHLEITHQIEKKPDNQMFHICDECGKRCTTKAGLQDHLLKHTKEKKFVCNICGKKLKRRYCLTMHMKIHGGEKNYQCDHCEAKYISPAALRNHKISKHTDMTNAEQYICSFCGKDFARKFYLERHVMLHTGEKKYKCDVCPKSFRLETSFKDHMNMHNGIKNFQCPHCDKRFTQQQQRTMHVRRHEGDKRHKCSICSQAFIEPRSLRNHIKTHQVQAEIQPDQVLIM